MTNSEIKKDELKPCPFCGGAVELFEVCRPDGIWEIHCFNKDCHAGYGMEDRNEVLKAWNTRTPEPTKAENGLVPITEDAVITFQSQITDLARQLPRASDDRDLVIINERMDKKRKEFIEKYGTPSITKEQLLAILPKLRNPILHDDPSDFRERNEQFTYSSSVESFNFAVLQMKQRIEELWK